MPMYYELTHSGNHFAAQIRMNAQVFRFVPQCRSQSTSSDRVVLGYVINDAGQVGK